MRNLQKERDLTKDHNDLMRDELAKYKVNLDKGKFTTFIS
jgi:hypothetical protein